MIELDFWGKALCRIGFANIRPREEFYANELVLLQDAQN